MISSPMHLSRSLNALFISLGTKGIHSPTFVSLAAKEKAFTATLISLRVRYPFLNKMRAELISWMFAQVSLALQYLGMF